VLLMRQEAEVVLAPTAPYLVLAGRVIQLSVLLLLRPEQDQATVALQVTAARGTTPTQVPQAA
jgi:hypothetical protein